MNDPDQIRFKNRPNKAEHCHLHLQIDDAWIIYPTTKFRNVGTMLAVVVQLQTPDRRIANWDWTKCSNPKCTL